MEIKIFRKKLLAILMIISILAADFFVLSSNLITYADQITTETNNENVEFSAYFLNKNNEEVNSIEQSITSENLKLYAKIIVHDGYIDAGTSIEILESNFNIKSSSKGTVEGNKVILNQIDKGETIIVLDIEPITPDTLTIDMLSQTSLVKLNGTYTGAESGPIQYGKYVCMSFIPDTTAKAELVTNIVTNKEISVDGDNKRVVQLKIKSRLKDNQYPVESTKLTLNSPQLGEGAPTVNVMALGELATNGTREISSINNTNGTITIILNNVANTKTNKINWIKNVYDELLVTFIYDETADTNSLDITTNSEIKVFNANKPYIATYPEETENLDSNLDSNNIIMAVPEITTEELYKGQLYANINITTPEDVPYETKTTLVVTNKDIYDNIVINEGTDKFILNDNTTLTPTTKYLTTELDSAELSAILGETGSLKITNGTAVTTINKTFIENNGNEKIVITHGTDSTNELEIEIIEPENTGVLELKHAKAITGAYTKNKIKAIKEIKTMAYAQGTDSEAKPTEAGLEIQETITKAEITIENNKQILSTTEANNMTLGITLVTSSTQYDLYEDPEIKLQFPAAVENVELNTIPTQIKDFVVDPGFDQDTKIYTISLNGMQTTYAENESTQEYLQLDLKVTLSRLATTQEDKIVMTYTNKNASQYYGGTTGAGVVEIPINIEAQPGVLKMFNMSLNKNTSLTQDINQQITGENAGKNITFETILVNNTENNMNNVKILGKLPTIGNTIGDSENTLETTLKGITAQNATVYYTQNINATADIADTTNGWSTDLTNAKMYLIEVGTLNVGSNYSTITNIQIPATIGEELESYTQYEVIYDTETQNNIKETSRKIGILTYVLSDVHVKLSAQVGQDILNDGDIVKEGEVVRYTATVTNYSSETITEVKLSAGLPNGTVLVKPIDETYTAEDGTVIEGGYVYILNQYYKEITDETEIANTTSVTIPWLAAGQSYILQYEARVNTDIIAGTQISNKAIAIYNKTEKQSAEIINSLQESNIRVTMKKAIDESIKLTAGSQVQYDVIIENLSNTPVNGLGLQIISDDFVPDGENISVGEIPANDKLSIKIKGKIKDDADQIDISAIVTDSNNTYRSNIIMEELMQTDATITLTTPQNNQRLKEGDDVEYTIVVTNTGEVEGKFKVYYSIPEQMTVQSVLVNGKATIISNLIYEGIKLAPSENATIKVTATVNEIKENVVINNTAKVESLNVYKDISQEITHTLINNSTPEEEVGNIISGTAWIDENRNGQKDSTETALTGITVKLYDKTAKKYLTNAVTNNNGLYALTNISDGSYIVVFEYDKEKYEFTTSFANGVDTTVNSKAQYQNIEINGEIITVVGVNINNLQEDISNINLGVKEKQGTPSIEDTTKSITGLVWLDANKDGRKDDNEKLLSGIQVRIYDIATKSYLKDGSGTIIQTSTNSLGEYYFANIEQGSYIVVFNYDKQVYEPTIYLAEKVDKTKNSKATKNTLIIDGKEIEVTSTDMIELQKDTDNINLGLKEKQNSEEQETNKLISGFAWLDENRNGKKDENEIILTGIKVKLYNVKDQNGKIIETTTDAYGKYVFNDVEKGSYIVLFEYDTEEFEPTTYFAQGVDTTQNSKVMLKKININGQEMTATVTDVINLEENTLNINIGLREKLIFDLQLNKYINRIVVQTNKETKAYDYENSSFEKVEIHKKQIQGALVVLEYTIKVKNNGEIAGYAKNIVDYLPQGLTFSSELNKDWYISDGYLHTKGLENVEIKPGEEKEIKLILTKTMTSENVGLINNRAEIYKQYNDFGEVDINSTPNNQIQNENDLGVADVIIGISTGGSVVLYTILIMANIALMGIAIVLMIRNGLIKIPTKEERR